MTWQSALRWLVLLCAETAVAAYCVAEGDPLLYLLAAPGVLLAWWLTDGRDRPVPRKLINTLVALSVGFAGLRALDRGLNVNVFAEFIILVVGVKMLDRRRPRDSAQIIILCVFLVIAAVLTSNALPLGVILLWFLPLLAATAVVYQPVALAYRVAQKDALPYTLAPADRRGVRRVAGLSTCAAMVVSIGVFLVMPRGLGSQQFGSWGSASIGQQVTGFTDEVQLGTGGLISQSPTPVLDLRVFGADGTPRMGSGQVHYLRGAVLDEYENGRWRATPSDVDAETGERRASATILATGRTLAVGSNPRDWDTRAEITIRNHGGGGDHIFTIWAPVMIVSDQPARMSAQTDTATVVRGGPAGKFTYEVRSRTNTNSSSTGDHRRGNAEFPSEVVANLAAELLDPLDVDPDSAERPIDQDRRAALRFMTYLRSGEFRYTLETLAAPYGEDPVEWFLTENKEGHCEYFASALAALCRSVGINARVVTGYVATDYNETTGHYLVRESNAHAWTEVEVTPGVWEQMDPTPQSEFRRIHQPPDSLRRQISRVFETIEYTWITAVVGYSDRTRRSLFGGSFDLPERFSPGRVADRVRDGGSSLIQRGLRNAAIAGGVAFAFGIGVVALRRSRWRPRLPWISARRAAAASLHRDLLAAFRAVGLPKPIERPILAHADYAVQHAHRVIDPDARTAFTNAARLVSQTMFAAAPPSTDDLDTAHAALTRARRSLRVRKRSVRKRHALSGDN